LAPRCAAASERDHAARSRRSVSLAVLGLHVLVECPDPELRRLLVGNFGAIASPGEESPPDIEFSVDGGDASSSLSLVRRGHAAQAAADSSDLLFLLEKQIIIELQRRRADLFFLHAAAIALAGKVCLLAAESGGGKSTTTWGMLHHGFDYLTDELSAVDIQSMRVFPYPHAICLKRQPPNSYPLPTSAMDLGRTIHVPACSLPGAAVLEPRPLGAVFLLKYQPDLPAPEVRVIGPAEAGARLYANALNALAHADHGLDAVARIAEHVPCFSVSSAGLPSTCRLIRAAFEQALADAPPSA
jgi:hypothetical protein